MAQPVTHMEHMSGVHSKHTESWHCMLAASIEPPSRRNYVMNLAGHNNCCSMVAVAYGCQSMHLASSRILSRVGHEHRWRVHASGWYTLDGAAPSAPEVLAPPTGSCAVVWRANLDCWRAACPALPRAVLLPAYTEAAWDCSLPHGCSSCVCNIVHPVQNTQRQHKAATLHKVLSVELCKDESAPW